MISITSKYGLYLYTGKVDMRKGINGLCRIISEDLGHNPRKPKSVYVFSGRNPRVKKVLIREYNRYELTTIRRVKARTKRAKILYIFFGIHTTNVVQLADRIEQRARLAAA